MDDIRQRRLKIARFKDLNDPFELLGPNLSDRDTRRKVKDFKKEMSSRLGILCFSRKWQSCLMWSHYASRHRGLCLGFDVSDVRLQEVHYEPERSVVDPEALSNPAELRPDIEKALLFTKYLRWRYEREHRIYLPLAEREPKEDHYFEEFSENLKLTSVIVGAKARISRRDVQLALGDLSETVETFKATLSVKGFFLVRQRNEKLWK